MACDAYMQWSPPKFHLAFGSSLLSGFDTTGSSLSGNVLIFQASVSGNRKKVFGLCKCVCGTRPVSAQPLDAI